MTMYGWSISDKCGSIVFSRLARVIANAAKCTRSNFVSFPIPLRMWQEHSEQHQLKMKHQTNYRPPPFIYINVHVCHPCIS